ncbi:MAG TPA: hypothetical protein P5121_31155 [Caldilineaceae bacterium]|nr:hypothetical protein [Caldilineaceae bacterium]
MIELETERLTLRKGRTIPPTQAELETDYHRYVTDFAELDVTFAQYQEVILGSYYKDKEDGPFGYYTIYLDIPSQSPPMLGAFSPFLAGGEGGWGDGVNRCGQLSLSCIPPISDM